MESVKTSEKKKAVSTPLNVQFRNILQNVQQNDGHTKYIFSFKSNGKN